MFQKSENSEALKPLELEPVPNGMIVRRNFKFVEAVESEDMPIPAHWEYEEWQMTNDQYDVYLSAQADIDFLTMENEYLDDLTTAMAALVTRQTEEAEQARADIDYLLMLADE